MKKDVAKANRALGWATEARLTALSGYSSHREGGFKFEVTLGLDVALKVLEMAERGKKNGVRKSKPAAKPRRSKCQSKQRRKQPRLQS